MLKKRLKNIFRKVRIFLDTILSGPHVTYTDNTIEFEYLGLGTL